ncbi:hypothetical protein [Celeribacter halophilus]|uniref:Uncharacterized protein n=1 Tax=Celeribacter halophilus TaxID=576117 RepID=A0A1I3V0V8_9RHOB|nr:hypothetical protein [Celeribacter halophilus]PZX09712.1 hypothetical protein LX82_02765 [Celeribacter halophilus]SFJ88553.1 hypothetical protein SAMN04488138_11340 [Celeribacter halophilus]
MSRWSGHRAKPLDTPLFSSQAVYRRLFSYLFPFDMAPVLVTLQAGRNYGSCCSETAALISHVDAKQAAE